MMEIEPLDYIPLWLLSVFTLVLVVISIEVGYRMGKRRRRQGSPEADSAVGSMVGAIVGLLAFLLAFTFGLAASRYDSRRQIFLDEVNAIGTAYLRTDFLPPPHQEQTRDLLRRYVENRLAVMNYTNLQQVLHESENLHTALWAQTAAVSNKDPRSIPIGLFISSINELIDLHTKRAVTISLQARIPVVMWAVLYGITILAMSAMGYHMGLVNRQRSLLVPVFALTFSSVIFLIADLDRPHAGTIRVSQKPMIALLNTMQEKP
ncbi:MAG: hypothetical protein U0840_01815 [Gemmataceae bacterium]